MASAASCPRRVEIHAIRKSATDDPLGPDRSTCPLGPDGFMVSRFTIRSTVASWFPDSPRCGLVRQADCAGGVPIVELQAVLCGKTGAPVGGGGMRVATACGCICCCVCTVELAWLSLPRDGRLSRVKRVNEWSELVEAFWYSQHGRTICPEGAVSS